MKQLAFTTVPSFTPLRLRVPLPFRRLLGCALVTALLTVGGSAEAQDESDTTLVEGDSAWNARDYVVAAARYQIIVERDSGASTRALFRLATLRAWDNRLGEAVVLHRKYVALEPKDTEGRLALARTLAWWGRYAGAIAIFDSVIAQDSTYRDAVIGRAQVLAWAGRIPEALPIYRAWIAAHPADRDASLGYARTLSWDGALDEAEALYTLLSTTAGDGDAQKGRARVIGWRGELQRSEGAWRAVLADRPTDPEALVGLAQVMRWQDRSEEAERALQDALRVQPGYGDALALMRWVRADLRPSASVEVASADDSDRSRATTFLTDITMRAPWHGMVGAAVSRRAASYEPLRARSNAQTVTLYSSWQPDRTGWTLRAEAGATRQDASRAATAGRQRTIGRGSLRATGPLTRQLTIGASAAQIPFDETALLIESGVVTTEVAGDAELALPGRVTASGAASRAWLNRGARDNRRDVLAGAVRWTHSRRWSLAAGVRRFGYDTTSSDGYFAPRRYLLAELSGRGRLGGELGWYASGDASLGRQSITLFGAEPASRLAERLTANVAYRFDPSREVSATGRYANVAAPGQVGRGEYSAYGLSLRVRLGL